MTALAQVFNQPLTETADIVRHDTILANTRIYAGTLAINDSGVIKIYTAALYAGGAKLLGFPVTNVFNDTASNVTDSRKFAFRRNCPMIVAPKSGDAPTLSNVGGTVYLKDNFTVGATDSGTDQPVTMLEYISATQIRIKLP
jgi:hypothetical protein